MKIAKTCCCTLAVSLCVAAFSSVLDNVVVKGFDVKELFAADNERRLSDHRIVGCVLEMRTEPNN